MSELIFTKSSVKDERTDQFEQLDRQWKKIHKHEKRNQNLVDKQDKLYQEFVERIEPYEHDYCLAMADKIKRLISFLPRKSLSQAQKNELASWIEEEISDIEYHPFTGGVDISELRNRFSKGMSSTVESIEATEENIEQMRIMFTEMFKAEWGVDVEFSDQELTEMAASPAVLEQILLQKMQEIADQEEAREQQSSDQDVDDESFYHENFDEQFEGFTKHGFIPDREQELEQLFKKSQLNKIYKRLASVLHPDKARNDQQKEQYKGLMQILAKARKSNDAFTLLKLYQEYIPDAELNFDEKTLVAIRELLIDKNTVLNDEFYRLKEGNSPKALVWRQFSAKTKKDTNLNFNEHLDSLLNATAEIEDFLQDCTTVKVVSKALSARIQDKRQPFFAKVDQDFFADIFDF